MKNTVAALTMAAMFAATAPANAGPKTAIGWSAIAAGTTLTITAWDYKSQCPAGYSTHRYQGLKTQCVWISRLDGSSDVRDQPTNATFKRPALLYSGLATLAGGIVVLALPTKAQKVAPQIGISPRGVTATKTLSFGK